MLLSLTSWLHGRALSVPVAAHFLGLGVAMPLCFCPLLFLLLFLTAANPSMMAPLALSNSSQNLFLVFRVGMASDVLSLEYFLSAAV